MSSIFDGMATVLNDVFGSVVTWIPPSGPESDITGRFRDEPVRVVDADGREILMTSPSLRVTRPAADNISDGDVIEPGNGNTYKILNSLPSGSPAVDAFVIFELEQVT